jgi:hypothetical protein
MKLSEIAAAAGCSKAYASDIRRRKWTPHVSTWASLSGIESAEVEFVTGGVDTSTVEAR